MDGPSPAAEEPTVIRVIRRQAVQDLVRAYTVFIDGSPTGKLWAFQRRNYPVSPGHHAVKLRIVGTGTSESADFSVEIGAGETRVFRTKKLGWKKVFLASLGIFLPDRFAPMSVAMSKSPVVAS